MHPNPGLSADVNRYLASLDVLLPRRSRKGDRAAQLLHDALTESAAAHAPVGEALNTFLQECESFHRKQFWVDPDFVNHDDGACWLPLVLAGHAWSDCLREIMRIRLPDSIGRARRIVLKPIGRDASQTVRAVLRKKISGVTEAAYNRFVSQVKPVATRLESVYDAESSVLEIHQGLELEVQFDDTQSSSVPVNGGMPVWLDTLLDLNAVEQLDLRYPLIHRDVPTVAEFVSVICVLPDCPVEWRVKDTFSSREAFGAITDALGQGLDDPFHLYVTAVENEWLPLVDAFVARASMDSPSASPEPGTEGDDLLVRHLGRLLTLHPAIDMRVDSEYSHLRSAYKPTDENAHVLVPAASIAALPEKAALSMVRRLDDVRYVTAWAKHFQARARRAIDSLTAAAPPPNKPSASLPRGVTNEFLVRVNASVRDFASCILAAIDKSLDVLIATETHVHEARSTRMHFQQMCMHGITDSAASHDAGELDALREVTRLALAAASEGDRARALAALVYALTENDVLTDSESFGRIDDQLVIANLLADDSLKHEASTAAIEWSRGIRGRIDGMVARPVQSEVQDRYERLVQELSRLCESPPSANSTHAAGKKAKTAKQ